MVLEEGEHEGKVWWEQKALIGNNVCCMGNVPETHHNNVCVITIFRRLVQGEDYDNNNKLEQESFGVEAKVLQRLQRQGEQSQA